MRFDNHLGLKQADAEALFLCCLKGTEKGSPQECRAYPASVVGDGQDCPTAALIRLDSDLTCRLNRVASVKKQIGDYAAELVPVHADFWLELELFHHAYPWLAFEYFKRVSNKQIKVHLGEFGLEAAQGANSANELVDAVCSFADPSQGVLSEGGIVKVHRQILQCQTQS